MRAVLPRKPAARRWPAPPRAAPGPHPRRAAPASQNAFAAPRRRAVPRPRAPSPWSRRNLYRYPYQSLRDHEKRRPGGRFTV